MSMLKRSLPPMGRSAQRLRDDRLVIVATEDTYAPEQYFRAMQFDRVRVLILPTLQNDSAPASVDETALELDKSFLLDTTNTP